MSKFCVYDLKVDGVVIYVGKTNNPKRRLAQHRASKNIPTAEMVVVAWYETDAEALAAEAW
jgi:predicted GIY-YIG superfamily endonuclease